MSSCFGVRTGIVLAGLDFVGQAGGSYGRPVRVAQSEVGLAKVGQPHFEQKMDTMGVGGVDDAPAWRIGPVGIENIGARQAAGRQWRGGGPVRCGVDYSVCHTAFYRSAVVAARHDFLSGVRSEEHTSELQSLMRISYAVFCLKKKKH